MGVCLTNHFLCVPCEPDLLFRVAGTQQTNETIMLIDSESLGCHAEPAPHPPERIVLATAMTTRLVLHASSALIEGGVGEADNVERISDLNCQRQHRVEHAPITVREIEGGPLDPISPLGWSRGEPSTRLRRSPAGDDVEKLASAHVDDLGRPRQRAEPAKTSKQCLVETERCHVADPIGMVHELLADYDDGVHHRVPAAAEFARHIRHSAPVATNMQRRPTRRACGERAAGRRDLRVVVAPATTTGRATPTLLAPHQPGRPPEHRQVNELDLADPMSMHQPATRATGSIRGQLDHHAQPVRPVADSNQVHVGQADQQRAHTRNIGFQAGAPRNSTTSTSLRLAEPLWHARDQPRTITQPSNAENRYKEWPSFFLLNFVDARGMPERTTGMVVWMKETIHRRRPVLALSLGATLAFVALGPDEPAANDTTAPAEAEGEVAEVTDTEVGDTEVGDTEVADTEAPAATTGDPDPDYTGSYALTGEEFAFDPVHVGSATNAMMPGVAVNGVKFEPATAETVTCESGETFRDEAP